MSNITKAIANCTFNFIPVKIERGRKFRGMAYLLSGEIECRGNCYTYDSAKLWDPDSKKIVYANLEFCNDVTMPDAEIQAAKEEYVTCTIDSTVQWCRSTKPNLSQEELEKFARNVLLKHHADMKPVIDEVLPDKRDVGAEVQKTLNWAMTLKTQPCWIYGRWCAGGKPLPDDRKVHAAWKALHNKGIDKLDGFEDAWTMACSVMGLDPEMTCYQTLALQLQ